MIVSELIELLQECPAGLRVVVNGYEEGYDDLSPEQISIAKISLNTGKHSTRHTLDLGLEKIALPSPAGRGCRGCGIPDSGCRGQIIAVNWTPGRESRRQRPRGHPDSLLSDEELHAAPPRDAGAPTLLAKHGGSCALCANRVSMRRFVCA